MRNIIPHRLRPTLKSQFPNASRKMLNAQTLAIASCREKKKERKKLTWWLGCLKRRKRAETFFFLYWQRALAVNRRRKKTKLSDWRGISGWLSLSLSLFLGSYTRSLSLFKPELQEDENSIVNRLAIRCAGRQEGGGRRQKRMKILILLLLLLLRLFPPSVQTVSSFNVQTISLY